MKRKILSLALIAALVFALSLSAFAEDVASGDVQDVITSTENVTASKGTIDKEATKQIAEEVFAKDFFEKNEKVDAKVDEIVAQVAEAGKTIEEVNLGVVAAFEFQPDADMLAAVGRNEIVKVTFENLVGITTSDTVIVMHKVGSEWVVLNARVTGDGKVEVDFDGFSPVTISKLAIVYSSNPTNPTNPSNNNSTVKSPQTSDIG